MAAKKNPIDNIPVLDILKDDPATWDGPKMQLMVEHFRRQRAEFKEWEKSQADKKNQKSNIVEIVDPSKLGGLF